jgi:hypothetical protein
MSDNNDAIHEPSWETLSFSTSRLETTQIAARIAGAIAPISIYADEV